MKKEDSLNLRKKKSNANEDALAAVYARMQTTPMDDPLYATLVSHAEALSKIPDPKRSNRPSADTMWIVGGAVAQVLVIVAYEHSHVLVSKATGFILKTKV